MGVRIGIKEGEGYTTYRGGGDTAPKSHLSGIQGGIQDIKIHNPDTFQTHPSIAFTDVADNKNIEAVLHKANIPFQKDQKNQVRIANTAKEIAAYRLGVWAEENFEYPEKITIKKASQWDKSHTITLKDGTKIELDKNIKITGIPKNDIVVLPDGGYRYDAIKLGKQTDYDSGNSHAAVDIAQKVVEHVREGKSEIQTAITNAVQTKYKEYLAEAEKELQSGAALLKPIYALVDAGHITLQQATEITQHELEKGRVKLGELYSDSSDILEIQRAQDHRYTKAKDVVSLNVFILALNLDMAFLINDSIPQSEICIPNARAPEFGKIFGGKTGKEIKGKTTFTFYRASFEEVINKLEENSTLPKAIADKIEARLHELYAQAQREVIDKLPPDTGVSDAQPMGKAKEAEKGAKRQ